MTGRVIITGQDLDVEVDDQDQPDRRRPAPILPPVDTSTDLAVTIANAAHGNPYWSAEANNYADAHPEIRPIDHARRWAEHRIETP